MTYGSARDRCEDDAVKRGEAVQTGRPRSALVSVMEGSGSAAGACGMVPAPPEGLPRRRTPAQTAQRCAEWHRARRNGAQRSGRRDAKRRLDT